MNILSKYSIHVFYPTHKLSAPVNGLEHEIKFCVTFIGRKYQDWFAIESVGHWVQIVVRERFIGYVTPANDGVYGSIIVHLIQLIEKLIYPVGDKQE